MHSILPLLLLFLLSSTITTSFPFSNCTQTFSCGPLHNLSYPFTGGPRPAHCGPPQFHLTCTNNNTTPIITINSLSYRVIQINQTQNTLTLSRLDLYNNTCTHNFTNTTLNSTLYTLTPNNKNLTIFYACTSLHSYYKLPNLFQCKINGSYSDAYCLTGPVPTDPVLAVIRCNVTVQLPLIETAAVKLKNSTVLAGVLMEGFSVNYWNPYGGDCDKCHESGGVCGFDDMFGGHICICGDQVCPKPGIMDLL